jgi:3-deoxy-manno-octulosonate cytidylyltransferase (CMP-KDO synthetase)
MKIAAVIPSRFQSSRFPGKPLVKIAGKTMIERVYRQVAKAGCFSDIIVATDDRRIFNEVTGFGGKAEMTDSNIESGSARVWSVVEKKDFSAVVNIQGDEPLISEKLIFEVCRALRENPVVSAARPNASYEDFCSTNVVKVVCDQKGRALYFSRAPIPYSEKKTFAGFFQHIGIYGYTKEMLEIFIGHGICELEKRENLEQLRFLFLGLDVHLIQTDFVSHGVDIPEDVTKIEKLLGG